MGLKMDTGSGSINRGGPHKESASANGLHFQRPTSKVARLRKLILGDGQNLTTSVNYFLETGNFIERLHRSSRILEDGCIL